MITGKKSKDVVSEDEAISSSRIWIAVFVVALTALIVWAVLTYGAPPPAEDDFF